MSKYNQAEFIAILRGDLPCDFKLTSPIGCAFRRFKKSAIGKRIIAEEALRAQSKEISTQVEAKLTPVEKVSSKKTSTILTIPKSQTNQKPSQFVPPTPPKPPVNGDQKNVHQYMKNLFDNLGDTSADRILEEIKKGATAFSSDDTQWARVGLEIVKHEHPEYKDDKKGFTPEDYVEEIMKLDEMIEVKVGKLVIDLIESGEKDSVIADRARSLYEKENSFVTYEEKNKEGASNGRDNKEVDNRSSE